MPARSQETSQMPARCQETSQMPARSQETSQISGNSHIPVSGPYISTSRCLSQDRILQPYMTQNPGVPDLSRSQETAIFLCRTVYL